MIAIITTSITIPLSYKNTILHLNSKLTRNHLILIIILALLGTVLAPNIYFIGIQNSSSSDAAILSNAEIIFTVFFALILFKEKLPKSNYLPLILISFSVLVISTKLNILNLLIDINKSNFLIIISMLLWSFDNNISKILFRNFSTIQLVQIKTALGSAIILLIIWIFNINITINHENILSIVVLSIISFTLPMLFLYHAIKNVGTIFSILVLSTSPIFGILYSVIFLNENMHDYQIIAILIMFIGILLLYKYK